MDIVLKGKKFRFKRRQHSGYVAGLKAANEFNWDVLTEKALCGTLDVACEAELSNILGLQDDEDFRSGFELGWEEGTKERLRGFTF